MVSGSTGRSKIMAKTSSDGRLTGKDRIKNNGHETQLRKMLQQALVRQASDVHLIPGYPASFRIHGRIHRGTDLSLDSDEIVEMLRELAPNRWCDAGDGRTDFDFSVTVPQQDTIARFRASVYVSHECWSACLRHIPDEIPSLEWLGFPEELADRLVAYANGLVVVTGITGSGKTATLDALVSRIRADVARRVLTVEEPIEYVHGPGSGGIVSQREVGRDVPTFADGLKYGLRQDPDVILVGEIRDRETAHMALSAAETGHLILTTMHTRDAKGAVSRLVDLFPQEVQEDVRKQVANSLRSVVCQHLLPSTEEGEKRTLALEVLHINQQVRTAIRSGKLESIDSAMQTGKRDGMVLFDDDLQRLVGLNKIAAETARRIAKEPDAIRTTGTSW